MVKMFAWDRLIFLIDKIILSPSLLFPLFILLMREHVSAFVFCFVEALLDPNFFWQSLFQAASLSTRKVDMENSDLLLFNKSIAELLFSFSADTFWFFLRLIKHISLL